jgi:hypothetical protein
MSKYSVILEALQNRRDNTLINETYTPKKGDRFKVLVGSKFGIPGDILILHSVPEDPNYPKENAVLARLKKDGTPTSILGKGNWVASSLDNIKSFVDDGKLLPIESEEDLKKGEVDYSAIKDVVKNLGLDKLFKGSIPRLMSSSGRYYMIYLGEGDVQRETIYKKLKLALERRGIKVHDIPNFKDTRYLFIDKIQI